MPDAKFARFVLALALSDAIALAAALTDECVDR
jgi:hypothetical protein